MYKNIRNIRFLNFIHWQNTLTCREWASLRCASTCGAWTRKWRTCSWRGGCKWDTRAGPCRGQWWRNVTPCVAEKGKAKGNLKLGCNLIIGIRMTEMHSYSLIFQLKSRSGLNHYGMFRSSFCCGRPLSKRVWTWRNTCLGCRRRCPVFIVLWRKAGRNSEWGCKSIGAVFRIRCSRIRTGRGSSTWQ